MEELQDIDEEKIARLVHLFYGRVRADPDLGPIFNRAVEDWPEHLEKLTA
ncbi:MAG TPA: preprotein translocase subunit TatC, partial [Candidatus Binatia bacterium]|nr:preprotein translocase subunit TatC [Candidatus Binatia bacterium]